MKNLRQLLYSGDTLIYFSFFILLSCTTSTSRQQPEITPAIRKKINFNLDAMDAAGTAESRRMYEFCIPNDSSKMREVSKIDPTIKFYKGSSGFVGCRPGQYLCIGYGGTKTTLIRIASLKYVKRIGPFIGE